MITRRRGFSLIELLIAVVVLGVMTAISMPHVQRVIASKRVTSAATVVAIDLEQAFTLASRQRRPVVLACDCAARTYTITDAASGRVYLSRNLGADAALQVDTLNFSTPSVTRPRCGSPATRKSIGAACSTIACSSPARTSQRPSGVAISYRPSASVRVCATGSGSPSWKRPRGGASQSSTTNPARGRS